MKTHTYTIYYKKHLSGGDFVLDTVLCAVDEAHAMRLALHRLKNKPFVTPVAVSAKRITS